MKTAVTGPVDLARAAFQRGGNEQAIILYREAAYEGNADAQNALGVMYEDGRGVPQGWARAAAWYRKAAEQANRK